MIDALVDEALAAPDPVSSAERGAGRRLRAERAARARRPLPPRRSSELRYVDAIRDGLREVMRRRPETVLIGQDIAEYGGVFKATEGFVDEFGKARVRNTPIIESGALGAALGLALDGFRPDGRDAVRGLHHLRLQPDREQPGQDALPLGRGACPSWCARRSAAAPGAGPFHSQNVEAWFTHVAGLKVVAPATPYDAKGLLTSAFEDGNPVLYLEHKLLYRSAKRARPLRLVHAAPGPGADRARRDGGHDRDLLGGRRLGPRRRRSAWPPKAGPSR